MSIEVTLAEDTAREWGTLVDRSAQSTVFHRAPALRALADHASADLHRLVGFKGQEPVGLFPVFVLRKGPVATAFSPPPGLRVPYLGPALLNMDKLGQRKAERRQRRFLDACLDWVDDRCSPSYLNLRLSYRYPDLRPLTQRGFEPTPAHTYVVDLSPGREDLRRSFSSDARRNIDAAAGERVTVEEGGARAIRSIHEQVRRRFRAQDVAFGLPVDLALDLYETLPAGTLRPYVCTVADEFVGGILVTDHGDTVGRWQGGVRTDGDHGVAVNDVLDWHVMTDAIDRGRSAYDLVGADNPRINGYKAKFDPDLRMFYNLERGSLAVTTAAHLYKRLRAVSHPGPK